MAQGRQPILQVVDVDKQYPNNAAPVLSGLTFEQHEGEFLAIVGPSGCGKTTLLRIISGLLTVTSGQIWHRGEKHDDPPPWLSVVFQDYSRSLYPWLTVRENVEFGLPRIAKKERAKRAREALEAVGLSRSMDMYPWQISGGMQQRCALARSLAAKPGLLLLDEPFASVDAQTRVELQDLVLKICAEQELATLLVTHDIDEAIYMADRVVVLSTRPASAVEQITVPIERPRDQLVTKESPEFLRLRHHLFTSIRREATT